MDRPVRVLLADDHAVVRAGLRMVLDAQPSIEVVGEAEDGRQALDSVEPLHPDVVVMDIAMPNLNGLEATRQIKRRFPQVQVVILSMHENRQYFLQVVQAGASGCVLKRAAATELVTAVLAAAEGEHYFSPAVATMVLSDYKRLLATPVDTDASPLTEREREIVQLVAEGRTSREIADQLTLSIKTVQAHRANIMGKLDAHDRTDLVKYAIRQGIIDSE